MKKWIWSVVDQIINQELNENQVLILKDRYFKRKDTSLKAGNERESKLTLKASYFKGRGVRLRPGTERKSSFFENQQIF